MSASDGVSRRQFVVSSASVLTLSGLIGACGGSSSSDPSGAPSTAAGTSGGGGGGAIDQLSLVVPVMPDLVETTRASVQGMGPVLIALEPLVRYTPDRRLEPNLASEFRQRDPLTYVYRLRQGVRFWDGTPLTVEDVLYSFSLHSARGTESFIAQLWSGVRSARRTGADEITIRLAAPNPQFAYSVAQTGIVSERFHRANARRAGGPDALNMGTGPYRFESFEPSSRATLVRNDDYWGEPARVGRLDLRTISDDSTRLLTFQSGDADGIIGIPIGQVKAFEGIRGAALETSVDYSVYKLSFDMTKAPWNDPDVRAAIAHAVDKESIASGILAGNAQPATTLTPPEIMETLLGSGEVDSEYARLGDLQPTFDVERGKQALARSTQPHGLSTTVLVTGSDPNLAAIMQTIAQSAKEIGVDLRIKEVDDNTYYNAVYFKHTTDGVAIDNFSADGPDPVNIPANALLSSNGYPGGSGVNVADYHNAKVDSVLARQGRLTADDRARGPLIVDALEQAAHDLPYVPIAYPKVILGLRDDFRYDGFNTFWWMNRWPDQFTTAS